MYYDFLLDVYLFLNHSNGQTSTAQVLLLALAMVCKASPVMKRSALSAGDGESIEAFHGFYGNPIYRYVSNFVCNI